ncbi:Condensin complex subunit [Thalictrum thalictroides]|uniref:Condensin complex subunit 2 n=1 Tax=Thalictrum thalictroides TaxID=46969 RepID=A0A7J6XH59_THATH|nr:Condensin complex subunit [Thalictrum thalictroides]
MIGSVTGQALMEIREVGLGKSSADESREADSGPLPPWDDESGFCGQFDDGNDYSDVEDPITLVSQPRQVNKIEVHYDKTSKQADVHALKGTLWNHIQETANMPEMVNEAAVSFRSALANFPADCQAAAREDISPHLCFICLLHLANEHNLSIRGCPNMDDLHIGFPNVA